MKFFSLATTFLLGLSFVSPFYALFQREWVQLQYTNNDPIIPDYVLGYSVRLDISIVSLGTFQVTKVLPSYAHLPNLVAHCSYCKDHSAICASSEVGEVELNGSWNDKLDFFTHLSDACIAILVLLSLSSLSLFAALNMYLNAMLSSDPKVIRFRSIITAVLNLLGFVFSLAAVITFVCTIPHEDKMRSIIGNPPKDGSSYNVRYSTGFALLLACLIISGLNVGLIWWTARLEASRKGRSLSNIA
eukprot:ANDGO_02564.mRNA.1 hypothetical protein